MTNLLPRRDFLTGSVAAAAGTTLTSSRAIADSKPKLAQEFYELRVYRNDSKENQKTVLGFVEGAVQPALDRMGIDRLGIFTPRVDDQSDVYVLIPYASLDLLAKQNDVLEKDDAYHKAAADFFAVPKKEAAYTRVDSRLMKAFAGMPVLEAPSKDSKDRLLELRIYESHNEHKARLKVEMFNEGEIDIMRDVELGPVFFGETLISNDVPNLTYMLSADSDEAHKKHWDGFRKHPEWDRMKRLPRYKDTVSKIVSVYLSPTESSAV